MVLGASFFHFLVQIREPDKQNRVHASDMKQAVYKALKSGAGQKISLE